MVLKTKLDKLQRSLCTPLDAVAYTNEFLIVSGAVAAFAILLLVSFAGNIETMSEVVGKINEKKQEILNEKIGIISSEKSGNTAVIILTNYGLYDSVMIAFFLDNGNEVTCSSNNVDSTDMTILSGGLLEVTCPVSSTASKVLIVTDTQNILNAKL